MANSRRTASSRSARIKRIRSRKSQENFCGLDARSSWRGDGSCDGEVHAEIIWNCSHCRTAQENYDRANDSPFEEHAENAMLLLKRLRLAEATVRGVVLCDTATN
jgi:hypothetical protein